MKIISLAAALVIGGLSVVSAEAMPMAPVHADTAASSAVTKVDYACGPGWRLTRWGECRPRFHRPPPRWGWERSHYRRDWYGDRGRGWGRYDRHDRYDRYERSSF
ncbi:DUF2613 domain-containing protein [Rhizobium sp. P32RR-XVIII]|uniref:DUF2613 domain-containing protein n=1 Tax=Rhizobium sp. P32RR-XVIII TaxID=2726738 RepID=UPI0014567C7D|nr:DUF2613 domain-containing protein [Rhizobium sp. P32RR-XVIII]NLS02763.1 DUF2613 domain-containing protein [Rhizobium sp. P32RR-XVIII]